MKYWLGILIATFVLSGCGGSSSDTDSQTNTGSGTPVVDTPSNNNDTSTDTSTDSSGDSSDSTAGDESANNSTDTDVPNTGNDSNSDSTSGNNSDVVTEEPNSDTNSNLDSNSDSNSSDSGTDTNPEPPTSNDPDPEPPSSNDTNPETPNSPDFGDSLDILIIGSSRSIDSARPFLINDIATELSSILNADMDISVQTQVEVEDIYTSKKIDIQLGSSGSPYNVDFYRHSLMQYYHWPEGKTQRMNMLRSEGDKVWDYVVITADPYIIANVPGYYALGVNKIAEEVMSGGAQPLLLLQWPSSTDTQMTLDHFSEYTYRVGDGAKVELPVVPAGLAWQSLPNAKKDTATKHPTANGAYLAAASIYSAIMNRSAASSNYTYDDTIADQAWTTAVSANNATHYQGQPSFMSPYKTAGIIDRILNYNHTGTSTERGILNGLNAVAGKARIGITNGGTSPINFNYGRANTNFELNKQYKIDPARFDFSVGFPMQDGGSTGNTSMLYGLDKRWYSSENGNDLSVAFKMINSGELPQARAVPIRTLFVQMKEARPSFSAYSDNWHMSGPLNKATASFMYTLLTGHNVLYNEPDSSSADWINWLGYKTGYETAWTLTTMKGRAPGMSFLPSATTSKTVNVSENVTLSVKFVNQPTENVTVRFSTDKPGALAFSPEEMTFTPENHRTARTLTLTGLAGSSTVNATITATTTSDDVAFDGVVEGWRYQVVR